MGRKRNPADQWMPPRVYRGRSAYEFKGRDGKTIRLCPLSAPRSEVWSRYEALENPQGTVKALFAEYIASPQFARLAEDTRKNYRKYRLRLEPVFGHMSPDAVKPEHIRGYLDHRGKVFAGNREIQFFSAVFSWGRERGKCKGNPCIGVSREPEKPRERYVTDEEYRAVYDVAPPNVRAAMEIAYLCAARQKDVLKLTLFDVRDEGLFIRQSKTRKAQIKLWTPRLRAAVELARSQPSTIATSYVIHNRKGQPYTRDGFRSAWVRAVEKAREATGMRLDFTFHDLKAKGVSDYEGDKAKFSGNKRTVEVYDRLPEKVETLKK